MKVFCSRQYLCVSALKSPPFLTSVAGNNERLNDDDSGNGVMVYCNMNGDENEDTKMHVGGGMKRQKS